MVIIFIGFQSKLGSVPVEMVTSKDFFVYIEDTCFLVLEKFVVLLPCPALVSSKPLTPCADSAKSQ